MGPTVAATLLLYAVGLGAALATRHEELQRPVQALWILAALAGTWLLRRRPPEARRKLLAQLLPAALIASVGVNLSVFRICHGALSGEYQTTPDLVVAGMRLSDRSSREWALAQLIRTRIDPRAVIHVFSSEPLDLFPLRALRLERQFRQAAYRHQLTAEERAALAPKVEASVALAVGFYWRPQTFLFPRAPSDTRDFYLMQAGESEFWVVPDALRPPS